MTTPWIEIEQYQDEENRDGTDFSEYVWQARFACQVVVLPHDEWVKLKWGFNASALFDETLERQRLFLESQYAIRNEFQTENPEHRTLAFRYINRPGEVLLLSVLSKIHARTKEEALENASAFYRELQSTFPYDYTLKPAVSRDEFRQMSGWDILGENGDPPNLFQIKRQEVPAVPNQKSPFLQGLWQSGPRAHEQIWRSLATSPTPLLVNVSFRCTILYEKELQKLSEIAREISSIKNDLLNQKTLSAIKHWNEAYIERRLTPWKKFFYLQIHLVSPQKMDENLFRIIGTSLTLGNEKQSSPGYKVVAPRHDDRLGWQKKLRNLDFTFSGSYLAIPRLAEVADLEEVFSVMRLPYSPPENGFSGINFAGACNMKENNEI
jgi:hypothetical protein